MTTQEAMGVATSLALVDVEGVLSTLNLEQLAAAKLRRPEFWPVAS